MKYNETLLKNFPEVLSCLSRANVLQTIKKVGKKPDMEAIRRLCNEWVDEFEKAWDAV